MPKTTYRTFLDKHLKGGPADLPAIYHAVRNIPYGSTGERDPVKIIANNLGSCSGKHILLRDLLRETGRQAEVITMFTHFNRGIPSHPAMPDDLRTMIDGGEICDFHHYVRVRDRRRWIKLDATWHDALIQFGFPVNRDWGGERDTLLAATPIREYPAVEDLATWKRQLLTRLSPQQREIRAKFFRRLTEWMMAL
ncbi:MAG TPA: transglutaminase domain-containing protein [Burkholderiales bacterium]|nr:transglutaminase domain-containing protein [Burkholderiales bacterium]